MSKGKNLKLAHLVLFITQGNYAAAAVLYERVAEVREKVSGPLHPTVAKVLDSWADVLGKQVRARAVLARVCHRYFVSSIAKERGRAGLVVMVLQFRVWDDQPVKVQACLNALDLASLHGAASLVQELVV